MVRLKPSLVLFGSFGRHQNWNDRRSVACLVEILQIQRIVPSLVQRFATKLALANLELEDEHDRSDQDHGINSTPHSGNAELQEQRALETPEALLQYFDFGNPGQFLGLQV